MMSAMEKIVEKMRSAWGLIVVSTSSSKVHTNQLANTDHLESFFHQTLEVVCSMLVEVSFSLMV